MCDVFNNMSSVGLEARCAYVISLLALAAVPSNDCMAGWGMSSCSISSCCGSCCSQLSWSVRARAHWVVLKFRVDAGRNNRPHCFARGLIALPEKCSLFRYAAQGLLQSAHGQLASMLDGLVRCSMLF